jgi:hypothetical protein
MPRRSQFDSQVVAVPQARIASATRIKGTSTAQKPKEDVNWQKTAWVWYDTIGEFRFACSWVGNILSRALLYAAEDGKPTDDPDAVAAMEALFNGPDGQREMLRQLGIQFTVAGEAYLVGEDGGNDPLDDWYVVAASELTRAPDGTWRVGKKDIGNPLIIRLWRAHPRLQNRADSPARAVLPILSEIDGLTKHVAAQIDSRLAGAGILLMPDGISFATATQTTDANGDPKINVTGDLDPFLQELMDTMMTAIKNREDASALVPILLQTNGEYLDKVRHLTFSTPLDQMAIELRQEAIRRLALGMDMPPEVLTGTGDVNHWGAWQIEEASIKAHTEPLLHVITDSLTDGYLRPYLEGLEGWDEERARHFTIQADTSKMRLRPNRSQEALELYDRAILSKEATARENGFDPMDMMSDAGRAEFFTEKVAGGSTTPELVGEALRDLGVNVSVPPPTAQDSIPVQEARPTPSLLDHPTQDPPDPDRTREVVSDEAAAIAEVVVFRALERAGNRIKSKYRDHISLGAENVPPHTLYRFTSRLDKPEVDDVLMDAWSCLASLPPIPITAATLDGYTRNLIITNQPHDAMRFRRYLTENA